MHCIMFSLRTLCYEVSKAKSVQRNWVCHQMHAQKPSKETGTTRMLCVHRRW